MKTESNNNEPKWVRFVTGGLASCTAEVATLPIDTVKVRLQVQNTGAGQQRLYNGMFDCFGKIIKQEGVGGLYKGIGPGLLRQASYSSIRMGVYEPLRNLFAGDSTNTTFLQKLAAGGSAGGIGIAIANPADLIKIRMQADRSGTRYRHTLDAFSQITRQEGVTGLWTGVGPAIQRAIVVNAAELATYDQAKQMLVDSGYLRADQSMTHFAASFMAGFCAAAASSPVDVIKNRLMSQKPGTERQFTGMLDCALKTVRNEGVMALYKGFIPNWFRLGPWCIVMFVTYEKYRELAKNVWDKPQIKST